MTPSRNAQASVAIWICFPFSCRLMEGNKNQSQGAKSGEYGGWVTSWIIGGVVTAAACALALSWLSSRLRTPVRWRRLHHAWKTFRQTVVDIPVSRNRLSVLKRYGQILQRKTLLFVWKHFCFFRISQVGSHQGIPTLLTVASSWGRIGIPRFRLLLWCPKREETFLRQMFLACGCTSPPYSASVLHPGYGAPNGYNVSLRQGSHEEWEWDFPIKYLWYRVFHHLSFLGPS